MASFLRALETTAEHSVSTTEPAGVEHMRVEVTIDRCGFKLVNSERMFVAAFTEARYRIYNAAENRPKKASRLLFIDKKRTTWDGLLGDSDGIATRFESSLKRAGKRLANKVIYSK